MVVALTVTPALALILLRNAPLERIASRRWCRGCSAATAACWRGSCASRGYAFVTVARRRGDRRRGPSALGQTLLPEFKERDFLMHWVTEPATSHPEEVRITTLASKELRAIPGVRNFGAHIGQALLADEVVRHLLR